MDCRAIKPFRPAVDMGKTLAVLSFVENGALVFSIFEKDSVWVKRRMIHTVLEKGRSISSVLPPLRIGAHHRYPFGARELG